MPFTDSGRVCRGLSFVNHCRIMSYIIDNIASCIPAAESLSATGEHTRTFLDFVALRSPLSQLSRTRLFAHARGQFGQIRTQELRNAARICNPSILSECT